jgi:hypothetical protein
MEMYQLGSTSAQPLCDAIIDRESALVRHEHVPCHTTSAVTFLQHVIRLVISNRICERFLTAEHMHHKELPGVSLKRSSVSQYAADVLLTNVSG